MIVLIYRSMKTTTKLNWFNMIFHTTKNHLIDVNLLIAIDIIETLIVIILLD